MATEKSVMAVIRACRPNFRNDHDRVAFAVHASFLASGSMLTATGPPAFSDDSFSSPSTEEVGIDRWNELPDEYAFVYINPEKGSKTGKVLVKCLVMNDKLVVDALANKGLEPVHLEIDVRDYVKGNGGNNFLAQYKDLDKLVELLNTEVLSKLDGTKPASSGTSERSTTDVNEPYTGFVEPLGPQIHPSGVICPPVMPFEGGDLYPGPGAGMYPTRSGFGGDGSMLVGPNDPRWFGGSGNEPSFPGGDLSIPPGAHFDSYGPPGVPGFEPSRFARNPQGRGGTHPDLEHFGSGWDFI